VQTLHADVADTPRNGSAVGGWACSDLRIQPVAVAAVAVPEGHLAVAAVHEPMVPDRRPVSVISPVGTQFLQQSCDLAAAPPFVGRSHPSSPRWSYLEGFVDYPYPPETDHAERLRDALKAWGEQAFRALFGDQ
jgi:hypothetical protein